MHLFTFIFGIGLLSKVSTLKCYDCSPGMSDTCTTKDCFAGQKCGALRFTTFAGGVKVSDTNMKSCTVDGQCSNGSINFGVSRTVITSQCCTSDHCNNQAAPDAGQPKPNGKKCFQCNGKQCTATLNCLGNEDHCISATVNTENIKIMLKGCASKLMCTAANMPAMSEEMPHDIQCCQGDFCNSASITAASLLLLLVPLISAVLLS